MSSIHQHQLSNQQQQQPSNLSSIQLEEHGHHAGDHHHHHHMAAAGFISFPNSSSSSTTTSTTTMMNINFPQPIQSTQPMISDHHHQTLITPHLLSLHNRSSLWAWGEMNYNESLANDRRSLLGIIPGGDRNHHQKILNCSGGAGHLGVSAVVKMKKMNNNNNNKLRKKVREPRFSFKTLSDVDVLDDGYKWRKYGQKVVKNTHHPRSYYRCTKENCRVKKRVERLAEDPRMVITTYEGRHAHSPSQDTDDDDSSNPHHHLNTNFFW